MKPLDPRGMPQGATLNTEWELTPREFAALRRADPANTLLLDVRLAPEWEIARVQGAVHCPLHELEARADDLELERYTTIATLCHGGVRSLTAASLLRERGYKNVRSIAGGIELWSWAVDQSVPRYERQGQKVWLAPPATPA